MPQPDGLKAKKKSTNSLFQLLKQKAQATSGSTTSLVSPAQLFREFIVTGIDYCWQVNSGFEEHGKTVATQISFGPGAGLPNVIELKANITAKMEASNAKQALIVIQVQPEKDGQVSKRPICLMKLEGVHRSVKASISAGAGLSIANKNASPEELSLGLHANAEISMEGEYLYIRDEAPGWHRKFASDFEKQFTSIVGIGSRSTLKKTIGEFLIGQCGVPYVNKAGKREVDPGFEYNRENWFYRSQPHRKGPELKKKGVFMRAFSSTEWSADNLLKVLKFVNEERFPGHEAERLKQFGLPIPSEGQRLLLRTYTKWLIDIESKTNEESREPLDAPLNKLCFLKLWGASPTAQAGVSAKVKTGLTSANVTGSLKHTVYRYQTLTDTKESHPPEVITQDTKIDYRQILIKSEIQGDVKATIEEADLSATQSRKLQPDKQPYNMMTYESAVLSWTYSDKQSNGDANPKTNPRFTGICFGVSVRYKQLYECSKAIHATPAKPGKQVEELLKSLSAQLQIEVDEIKHFLKQSMFFNPEEGPVDIPNVILLESSFTVNNDFKPEFENADGVVRVKSNLLNHMVKFKGNLQVIRVRYRIADLEESKHTKFQLGFPTVLGEVGIELCQVDQVGREGIIVLDQCWMEKRLQVIAGKNEKEAYAHAIPLVALLHQ